MPQAAARRSASAANVQFNMKKFNLSKDLQSPVFTYQKIITLVQCRCAVWVCLRLKAEKRNRTFFLSSWMKCFNQLNYFSLLPPVLYNLSYLILPYPTLSYLCILKGAWAGQKGTRITPIPLPMLVLVLKQDARITDITYFYTRPSLTHASLPFPCGRIGRLWVKG